MLLLDEMAPVTFLITLIWLALALMALVLGISGVRLVSKPGGNFHTRGVVFLVLAILLLLAANWLRQL